MGNVATWWTLSASEPRLRDCSAETKSWICDCVNCSDGATAMAVLGEHAVDRDDGHNAQDNSSGHDRSTLEASPYVDETHPAGHNEKRHEIGEVSLGDIPPKQDAGGANGAGDQHDTRQSIRHQRLRSKGRDRPPDCENDEERHRRRSTGRRIGLVQHGIGWPRPEQ